MDKQRVIRNILFIIFVPTIIVAGFYTYKFVKKKIEEKKQLKDLSK